MRTDYSTYSTRSSVVARVTVLTAMLIVLAGALAACGGSSSSTSSSGVPSNEQGARPSGDSSSGEAVQSSGSAASGSAGEAAVAAPEDNGQGDSGGGDETGDFDRKVIKTASLDLRAPDVRETSAEAQRLASGHGGSVLNSRISRGDGSVSARLVLVVPAPEFEAALEELRGLGEEVTTDSVKGKDVTEEFVDLESRERSLLAAEESLLRLYDEADSVEDALSVQSELTKVRGEIEQVQGRIQYLENRTASSRISLNIEPAVGSTPASADWNPTGTVARAWNASLGILQTLATGAISAVVFSWWLVPAGAAGIASFTWWRSRNRGPGSGTPGSPQS